MKLRLRLGKIGRIIEIDDEIADDFTVRDLHCRVVDEFGDVIAGEFFLSLNNKDKLEETQKLTSECDIVPGDLVFIVPIGNWNGNTPTTSNDKKSAVSNVVTGSGASSLQSTNKSYSVCGNLTAKPSSQNNTTLVQTGNVHNDNTGVNKGEKCHHSVHETISTFSATETDRQGDVMDDNSIDMDVNEESEVDITVVRQCLSEPTLCREASDGQLPALLKELYENTQPSNGTESLSIVLHVLMLETGFNVYPETEIESISKLPDNFRCPGCLKFTYTYPGCNGTQCTVTIVPVGNLVMIHGKVTGAECQTRKCSLKPDDFVKNVTEDCTQCYHQLAKLSCVYKDAMCIPLVHDIRQVSGLPDLIGLLALTQEIKLKILSYLDLRSLLRMSSICQEFHDICDDHYVWRRLYLKEFGNRSDMSLSQDWKKLYKHEYKVRKERKKAMNRMRMVTPPYWGSHILPYNGGASNWIPPPMPGGIIGGDYDLFTNFPGQSGIPGRMGQQPQVLPRPRYDLIGPAPDVDPGPDSNLIPRPGFSGRSGGGRGNPFGFGGMGPRFF
ncbi:F-box only protein 7 [Mactra antiquata]